MITDEYLDSLSEHELGLLETRINVHKLLSLVGDELLSVGFKLLSVSDKTDIWHEYSYVFEQKRVVWKTPNGQTLEFQWAFLVTKNTTSTVLQIKCGESIVNFRKTSYDDTKMTIYKFKQECVHILVCLLLQKYYVVDIDEEEKTDHAPRAHMKDAVSDMMAAFGVSNCIIASLQSDPDFIDFFLTQTKQQLQHQ